MPTTGNGVEHIRIQIQKPSRQEFTLFFGDGVHPGTFFMCELFNCMKDNSEPVWSSCGIGGLISLDKVMDDVRPGQTCVEMFVFKRSVAHLLPFLPLSRPLVHRHLSGWPQQSSNRLLPK